MSTDEQANVIGKIHEALAGLESDEDRKAVYRYIVAMLTSWLINLEPK